MQTDNPETPAAKLAVTKKIQPSNATPIGRDISDAKLRALKPAEKAYRQAVGGGLYLEVSPTGSKLWRWKYRLEGRENRFSIGKYPRISLVQAREAVEQARKLVQEGRHPSLQKKINGLEAAHGPLHTLEELTKEWLGRSIRAVARETGISRTTIKKYLKDPEQPQYRERQPRVGHKLNAQFAQRLRDLFKHDLQLRRRDRRSAKKLYEALVAEGYTGSYSPVQRFVSELKKSVGISARDAFIPLCFAPGDALHFDWSEEYVLLGGVEHKVHVAQFRLCHSRKPFVVAYMNEKQEMVLDAFVRALTFFGGVPRRVFRAV